MKQLTNEEEIDIIQFSQITVEELEDKIKDMRMEKVYDKIFKDLEVYNVVRNNNNSEKDFYIVISRQEIYLSLILELEKITHYLFTISIRAVDLYILNIHFNLKKDKVKYIKEQMLFEYTKRIRG